MKWQAVLFDLDGTLVASELLNGRNYAELIPEINDPVETLVQRYEGMQFRKILRDIESRYNVCLPENFEVVFRKRLRELCEVELEPIPGIPEVLNALCDVGLPCCVASNAPLPKIKHTLEVTSLSEYFDDKLFSAYELNAWKPKPDLFFHAAKQMGVAPEHCAVIEDSAPGVAAGVAAGMAVFHYQPHGKRESRAGYECVQDMTDLIGLLRAN